MSVAIQVSGRMSGAVKGKHATAGQNDRIVIARAHRALGCRGVSRADLRYDDTAGEPGKLYLLEINTQPGMTPLSLVPEQAKLKGIAYGELVERLIEEALA